MKLSGKPPTQHKSKSLTLDWSRKTSRETRTSVFITLEVRAKKKKNLKWREGRKQATTQRPDFYTESLGSRKMIPNIHVYLCSAKVPPEGKVRSSFLTSRDTNLSHKELKKKRCVYQKRGIPRSHDTQKLVTSKPRGDFLSTYTCTHRSYRHIHIHTHTHAQAHTHQVISIMTRALGGQLRPGTHWRHDPELASNQSPLQLVDWKELS